MELGVPVRPSPKRGRGGRCVPGEAIVGWVRLRWLPVDDSGRMRRRRTPRRVARRQRWVLAVMLLAAIVGVVALAVALRPAPAQAPRAAPPPPLHPRGGAPGAAPPPPRPELASVRIE